MSSNKQTLNLNPMMSSHYIYLQRFYTWLTNTVNRCTLPSAMHFKIAYFFLQNMQSWEHTASFSTMERPLVPLWESVSWTWNTLPRHLWWLNTYWPNGSGYWSAPSCWWLCDWTHLAPFCSHRLLWMAPARSLGHLEYVMLCFASG